MHKKDNWTNEVLNSLEGIKKAAPGEELLTRIMAQLPKVSLIPKWQLRWAAVAASLLIALNIYVLDLNKEQTPNQSNREYVSLVEDFSLYQ